jgi:hypothetical protein
VEVYRGVNGPQAFAAALEVALSRVLQGQQLFRAQQNLGDLECEAPLQENKLEHTSNVDARRGGAMLAQATPPPQALTPMPLGLDFCATRYVTSTHYDTAQADHWASNLTMTTNQVCLGRVASTHA